MLVNKYISLEAPSKRAALSAEITKPPSKKVTLASGVAAFIPTTREATTPNTRIAHARIFRL